MDLGELFGSDAPPVDVTALAYDNRAVEPGTVFFCVRGLTRDGHEFAPDAVARGAVALVVDHPLGLGVPEVLVPDVRAAMAPAAAKLAGDPTAQLKVVGITGTNGKTTSAFIVRSLLEAASLRTGTGGADQAPPPRSRSTSDRSPVRESRTPGSARGAGATRSPTATQ